MVRKISKKPSFRKPFDSRHAKGSQILLKLTWQQFFQICHSISMNLSWKMSLLVICEILGLLFNTLTADGKNLSWKMSLLVICKILGLLFNTLSADGKYSLRGRENLPQPIQMQLSKKQNLFLYFFQYFWNLKQTLNILKQKRHLIGHIFPKFWIAKYVVR